MQLNLSKLLLLIPAVFIAGCNFAPATDNSLANDVDDLRLVSSDVTGWSERAGNDFPGWGSWVGNDVMDLSPINGAAQKYLDAGSLKFGIQYLQTIAPSAGITLKLDVYVVDYGTEEKAKAAFDKFKPTSGTSVTGFSSSVALIDETSVSFGCLAHAYFGRFYLEFSFNNYNPKNMSLEDAAVFLGVYRKKING